jgi:hypothetical protein
MKLENALREVSDFLEREPQEFIVIKCQREGDTHPDEYDYIVELFQTYFGKRMVTSGDDWWDLEKVTLGQCLDNKKNILVCGGPPLITRQNVDSGWESKNQEAFEGLLKRAKRLKFGTGLDNSLILGKTLIASESFSRK